MEGESFPIQFTGLSVGNQFFSHVSRSLTRLKAVFVTMFKLNPNAATFRGSQAACSFWHPMEGAYGFDKEVALQIQIGSKPYPEYPIRSLAEAYCQLRNTLGLRFSNDPSNIRGFDYAGESFIMSIDLETVLGAPFTGVHTISGDLLTIKRISVNKHDLTARNTYT